MSQRLRRVGARRVGRGAWQWLAALARVAGAVLCVLTSLLLHIPTRAGRGALRDLAAYVLPSLAPGSLRVGAVDALGPGEVALSGVAFADDRGAALVEGLSISVRPAWRVVPALLRGDDMPEVRVRARKLWAFAPTFAPSTAAPEPAGEPLSLSIPRVTLDVDELIGRIPGAPLRARRLHVEVGLRLRGGVTELTRAVLRGEVDAMNLGPTTVALDGRGRFSDAVSLDADATLRGEALRCDLSLRSGANGRVRAAVRGCALTAAALDRLAGRAPDAPLGIGARIDALDVTGSLGGDLDARASLALNTERVDAVARLGPQRQTLDLTLRHLSAARVVGAAPATDLHGVIRLQREASGGAQVLSLDTADLVAAVAGVPVPPLSLRARVDGDNVTVERLASPGIGLAATGGANLATGELSFHAAASVDAGDVAAFPWVAGRASGALRARLEAHGEGGRVQATLNARGRSLRAGDVSVDELTLDASLRREGARDAVTARLLATSLSAGSAVRDANVDVTLRGDPSASLSATIRARGDGLLAALAPSSPTRRRGRRVRRATGSTEVEARVAVDLSSPQRVRVQLAPSSLRLRGARAAVSGAVTVPRGASRGAPSGRARLDLGAHGALQVALGGGRATLSADRFDLRWLHPLLEASREVTGVLDGAVSLRPGRLAQTSATLRLSHARVPTLGACEASVRLEPGREGLSLRATLEAPLGAGDGREGLRATVDLRAEPPRRTGDAAAWLRGVRDAHVTLRHDLAALDAQMPSEYAGRGEVRVAVDAARARGGGLDVVTRVDAPTITLGVRGARGYAPAVTPLAARAVTCMSLSDRGIDALPVRLRVALGPADGASPAPSDCGDAPLLARSFVAASGGLQGPWRDALTRLSADLARADRRVSAETRAALRRTLAQVDASVGPIARADWPLRAVPRAGHRARLEPVPPPDLPGASEVHATLTARGSLLDARADLGVEFRAPSLPAAGVRDPVRARLDVRVAPERGDLLGRVGVRVTGLTQLGAEGAGGEVRLDGGAFGDGATLLARGADAMSLDHLSLDTRDLQLERLTWAQERGLRGELALALRHTRDPAAPVTLRARLSGLRARLGASASARLSEPVTASLNAALRARAPGGWTLHACADAEVRGSFGGDGCDPMQAETDAPPGALRASLRLPIEGTPAAPEPALDRLAVSLSARRFRLDALTPAVRGDGVGAVGGYLDGAMRWTPSGRGPEGELRVSEGSAEVVSVGERLRDLALTLRAEGGRITLSSAGFQLGGGRVALRGEADVSGALARTAEGDPARPLATVRLEADTTALPLGAEGNTYGWIDSHITYAMRFLPGDASGEVVVDRARVRLKEQETRDLQPLSVDPDIFELGRTRPPPVSTGSPYPMSIAFSIPNPLHIERSDLGVAIRGSGVVSRERGGWGVAGLIERAGTRGWFAVFGKRFEIDRLRVGLDGSVSVNPTLDISAAHNTVSGDRLTATVGGNLSAPTLGFTSANHPGASEVEVLAMLALGRSGAQSASGSDDLGAQAGAAFGSLLGAMTFGSLSRGLSIVPTLILEPGQGNAGRYGAGVALGPRFYLQATYGASTSAAQGTSTSSSGVFRVMLEVALSHAWSAAVAATANAEAQGGGVDVFWSP